MVHSQDTSVTDAIVDTRSQKNLILASLMQKLGLKTTHHIKSSFGVDPQIRRDENRSPVHIQICNHQQVQQQGDMRGDAP